MQPSQRHPRSTERFAAMPAYPRLRYSHTVPLPLRTTVIGHIIIFLALLAAFLGTLLTKVGGQSPAGISSIDLLVILQGRVYSDEVHYVSNFTEPGYKCNATTVYPGQLFGGNPANTTFVWTLHSSFAYSGQAFANCSVLPSSSWSVSMTNNVVTPTYDYMVQCALQSEQNVTFFLSAPNWSNQMYTSIDNGVVSLLVVYHPEPAFISYSPSNGLSVAWPNGTVVSETISSSSTVERIVGQFITAFESAVMRDFAVSDTPNGSLNPLPGVLYPCTELRKIWAPMWTIAWECYTSLAATFSPALTAVTWLLLRASGSPDTRDATKSLQTESPRSGLGARRCAHCEDAKEDTPLSFPDDREERMSDIQMKSMS